jgi:hypothetical protein
MKRILGGREARGPRREKHNLQQNDANDDNNHNNHSSSLVGLPTQTDLPFYALARGIASTREISSVMTGVRKLGSAPKLLSFLPSFQLCRPFIIPLFFN